MQLNPKKFNPLGFHLLQLLQDLTLRFIILFGGSSSGKTYSVAQAILIMTLYDGENTIVKRKVGATITKTIYEDFKVAAKQLSIKHLFTFREGKRQIVCILNGAKIDFGGVDDPEKIKGLSNYKRIILDEWSEFTLEDHMQIRLRLRGKIGQQIITTFNPIAETHWIKTDIFDKQQWHDVSMAVTLGGRMLPPELTAVKSMRMNAPTMMLNPRTGEMEEHGPDTIAIQTTYLNNFWVIGSPDGTYGFYDEQCIATFEHDRIHNPDYYNVYALGEWGIIRTGSEFFGAFSRGLHSREVDYDPTLPIHISVDNNVLPYISCTYWQVDMANGIHIRQFDETCAESPHNTVRQAAKMVAVKLKMYGAAYVYLHGDASTRASSTMDEGKRSWLDLFIDTLRTEGIDVVDVVGNKNPSVPMSGEFINAIFDGSFSDIEIIIGARCKRSIEDYMSVQKDANGAILKRRITNRITGQSYEKNGHLSDTFRYVVCDLLAEQFSLFSNSRKRNLYGETGAIQFYNPGTECAYHEKDLLYAMPNVNGKFAMVHGRLCGERWHIVHACLIETTSTDEILTAIATIGAAVTVVECADAYFPFVRELRKHIGGVKVLREVSDIGRRIAATSDYVKSNILFNKMALENDIGYSAFMANLLDFKQGKESCEASAALSGFVRFAIKSIF